MATGILSLRKHQIRAMREQASAFTRRQLLRQWTHEVIRLREQLYRAEQFDEDALLMLAHPEDVIPFREAMNANDAMTCMRCHEPPRGFRNKHHAAVWHILGLCQNCQDAGPTTHP